MSIHCRLIDNRKCPPCDYCKARCDSLPPNLTPLPCRTNMPISELQKAKGVFELRMTSLLKTHKAHGNFLLMMKFFLPSTSDNAIGGLHKISDLLNFGYCFFWQLYSKLASDPIEWPMTISTIYESHTNHTQSGDDACGLVMAL